MKHSNWFVSRKQQAHQKTINVVDVQKTTTDFDIHAKITCKACYGRGYIGRNLTTGEIVPCKCLKLKAKVEHREEPPTEDGHTS